MLKLEVSNTTFLIPRSNFPFYFFTFLHFFILLPCFGQVKKKGDPFLAFLHPTVVRQWPYRLWLETSCAEQVGTLSKKHWLWNTQSFFQGRLSEDYVTQNSKEDSLSQRVRLCNFYVRLAKIYSNFHTKNTSKQTYSLTNQTPNSELSSVSLTISSWSVWFPVATSFHATSLLFAVSFPAFPWSAFLEECLPLWEANDEHISENHKQTQTKIFCFHLWSFCTCLWTPS